MNNKIQTPLIIALCCAFMCNINYAQSTSIEPWQQKRFSELDTNGNGTLDNIEFRGTTKEWMTKANISEDEQVNQTNKKFKQFDTDNNQEISIEELIEGNKAGQANKAKAKSSEKDNKPEKNTQVKLLTHNDALALGDIAPEYLGTDREGNEVNLSELKGKIVIASFWVSWCKPCKQEMAILQNLQNQVGTDLLKIVAINLKESRRSYNKLKEQLSELTITLTHDKRGKISKNFGAKKAPYLFIMDKNGKVIFMDTGYQKTSVQQIVSVLKKELSSN